MGCNLPRKRATTRSNYYGSPKLSKVSDRDCISLGFRHGSSMTTAAMALVPTMGNIAISLATQAAINTADQEISGTVDKPDPHLTTAPSEYDSVSNTLFYSQYKNTSNEILSYSPAVSLTQQQYTAAKSIFEFCTSFAYMNGGRPYESNADGHTANCADFGNLYLPSNTTFEATISAFDGTNSSIVGPPSSVDELNDRIIGFANNVQNSPQAVGQTRQELGNSVETFAIEFTKEGNASYYYDLKNGTIMFTLSASSNLLLQSTTPFGIYDANPRVVNTQTYWRGVTSPDGQFVTTTINPIGPYMVYQDDSGAGVPYTLPPYTGNTKSPNSFATFKSIQVQGECPGSDETQLGSDDSNDLDWLDGAQLQFCTDYSSSLTQPYNGIAGSAFLYPSLWSTWEVQIVDSNIDYYSVDEAELALQVVFQYVASSTSSPGNPNDCAQKCGVDLSPGAQNPSPIPGSQWCDETDCNKCLASQFFDEMQLAKEDFCICNVWKGTVGTCQVETAASSLVTDAAALASALPSSFPTLPSSITVTAASASALLMLLTIVVRRAHLRRRIQYTNIPEISAEEV